MKPWHRGRNAYSWVAFAIIFIYFVAANAAILLVGNNAEFARIQDAIDAAKPGDFDMPGKGCTDANGNCICESAHIVPVSQNRDKFALMSWNRLGYHKIFGDKAVNICQESP